MPIFGAILRFIAGLWAGGFIGCIVNLFMPLGQSYKQGEDQHKMYAAWLGWRLLPI